MRRLAVLLPVLALTLIGCPGGGSVTVEAEPLLRYRFTTGASERMRTKIDVFVNLGAMGEMRQDQTEETTWVVKEVAADGTGTMTMTYDAVKLDMVNPMMGPASYDSRSENAAEQAKQPAAAGAAILVGKSISVEISPGGDLTGVAGFKSIMAALGDSNPQMQPGAVLLSDDTQKSKLQLGFPRFPKEQAVKGEQWSAPGQMSLPMAGAIKFDITFTLDDVVKEDVEKGGTTVAVISYAGEIKPEGFTAPEADPANPMTSMLSQMQVSGGKFAGSARFDMLKGRIDRAEYVLEVNLSVMGMDIQSTTKVANERIE